MTNSANTAAVYVLYTREGGRKELTGYTLEAAKKTARNARDILGLEDVRLCREPSRKKQLISDEVLDAEMQEQELAAGHFDAA